MGDFVEELCGVKRFKDIIICAKLAPNARIILLTLGRKDDDADRLRFRQSSQAGKHCFTIHLRHGNVKENQVGFFSARQLKSLNTIKGLDSFITICPKMESKDF